VKRSITDAKPGEGVYLADGIFARKKDDGAVQYGITGRFSTTCGTRSQRISCLAVRTFERRRS